MNKLEEMSVNIACSLIIRGNTINEIPRLAKSLAKEIIDGCEGEEDKYKCTQSNVNRIKKQK